MKCVTICIICVILGIMLSTMFNSDCGCKDIIEGNRDGLLAKSEEQINCEKNNRQWGQRCVEYKSDQTCLTHSAVFSCL
jgi:hypothetical protein